MTDEHGHAAGQDGHEPEEAHGHHDECTTESCPVATRPQAPVEEKCPPRPGAGRAVWRVTGLD